MAAIGRIRVTLWPRPPWDSCMPKARGWHRITKQRFAGIASRQSRVMRRASSAWEAMYVAGQGVPKDYVLAHMWLNLAAAKRVKKAGKGRDLLEILMTPDQIAEAQRLAREWKAKGK